MSYINNALRKAQQDKDSQYKGYENIVSASGRKPKRPRRWLSLAVVSVVLVCAAGISIFFFRSPEKKMPAAPLKIARPQSAVPAVSSVPAAPNTPATLEQNPPVRQERAGMAPVKPVTGSAGDKMAEQLPAGSNPAAGPVQQMTPEKAATAPVSEKRDRIPAADETADVQTLYAQALKNHQKGHLDEAKKLYKQVIKQNPRHVQALNNLGVVYMKKGVYKWATIRLQDALKLKPDYADAHYNLACVYAKTNDTESSLLRLKEAVDLNPEIKTWVKNDQDLENLRDLPGYKKLMEKL